MMTQDLEDTGSGKQFFACGHENPAGNRYCNLCGEVRGRPCPLCSTLNRGHAKFCGTCGARLVDEQAAPETPVESPTPQRSTTVESPTLQRSQDRGTPVMPHTTAALAQEWANEFGPDNPLLDLEEPPWVGRSVRRRNAFLDSSVDDMTVDDMTLEDELAAKDRRRKTFLLAGIGVTVAVMMLIVLGVQQFSPTRHGGLLERARGWMVAGRDSASAVRDAQPPAPEGSGDTSATRGAQPSAPEGSGPSAASSSRGSHDHAPATRPARPSRSKTAAPRAAMSESAQEATEAPAAPRAPELPATSPSLPSRSTSPSLPSRSTSQRSVAPADEAPSRGAAPAIASAPDSSEERMADFLIEQLGPKPAVEKALSTAAWYDADRSEHAFWERVADAIRRRAGS